MNKPSNWQDLTGQKFGRLLVVKLDLEKSKSNKKQISYWKCICDCGKEKCIRTASLKNGHTQSCGCLLRDRTRETLYKGNDYLSGTKICAIWKHAKNGNKSLPDNKEILNKWIQEIGDAQSGICNSCGIKFNRCIFNTAKATGLEGASLDRIDSSNGYNDKNNLQLLCWECNEMKNDKSMEKHIQKCMEIANYQKIRLSK